MRFTPGSVDGSWLIETEPVEDRRGFFARVWSVDEFAEHGLRAEWPHQNMQRSPDAGTMRGLHYQVPPHAEIKLVRCTRGSVFDVTLDLRPSSPTFMKWQGTVLDATSQIAAWVPEGCAHGYVTLEPDTDVYYLASHRYTPHAVRGVRYDDPAFAIEWPRDIGLVPHDYDEWPPFEMKAAAELEGVSIRGVP